MHFSGTSCLYTLCFSWTSSLCLRKCIIYSKNSEVVEIAETVRKWGAYEITQFLVVASTIYSVCKCIQPIIRCYPTEVMPVTLSHDSACAMHAEVSGEGFSSQRAQLPSRSQSQLWAAAFALPCHSRGLSCEELLLLLLFPRTPVLEASILTIFPASGWYLEEYNAFFLDHYSPILRL